MRFFLIFLSFLAVTGYASSPSFAADDADETSDNSGEETDTDADDNTAEDDADKSPDGDDGSSDDGSGNDESSDDGDKGDTSSDNADDSEDTGADDASSADDKAKKDSDKSDKDDAKAKDDKKDSKGILDSKKSKKEDKPKKNTKDKSDKKTEAMPFAKKLAICPRGLEDKDIREVFKGFSYEGFEKVSTDGEYDLNNGMMRKPWGFYKGLDKRQYAVYAFKPDPKNVVNVIDKDKLEAFKMLRIKIPEYCALYTEATPDEAGSDQHEPIGLLISRASLYKPRPVDPGSAKTEAVRMLIKNGVSPKDTGPSGDKKSSKSGEDDEENILKRGKSGKKDSLVDTSEAKIFQKLTDDENSDDDEGNENKDDKDDDTSTAKPDKKTLDGNVAGDSKEDDSGEDGASSDEDNDADNSDDADAVDDNAAADEDSEDEGDA